MSFENLVRSCLYNWLGYGNVNAPVWFMGMEEGGAEIWRQSTLTLEESIKLRSTYSLAMDFKTVWEDYYGIPLRSFKGITVWHYMAAFLLSLEGSQPTTDSIREFVFQSKRMGSKSSNHFLCEFLPLPRQSNNSISGYEPLWQSVRAYREEVMPGRFEIISDTLAKNTDVQLLVSYDKNFTSEALRHYSSKQIQTWQDTRGKRYAIHSLQVAPNRDLHMLVTPFFGQGQASYTGLSHAATIVQSHILFLKEGFQ